MSLGGTYQGRLELTWTNKTKCLLARSDGTYEWVDPTDYRVAEVRLLQPVETFGTDPSDNLLIQGDALYALRSLQQIPYYRNMYVGKVKLAYLDPPFNTQQAFAQFNDALEHSVWLTMMRDRLRSIRDLLSMDGSVWVHCDDSEQHRLRCVMDEVFGPDNFVATVIWEKTDSPRMDASYFSGRHDYILIYRRSVEFTINRLEITDDGNHYTQVDEEGRRYYRKPLRASAGTASTREARPNLYFPLIAPDGTEVYPKLPNGGDGRWRWSRERVERDAHLIDWVKGRHGWTPYYRIYETGERTRPPETIWLHTEVGSTRNSANEIKSLLDGQSFATPKPERLMQRIIHIASNPGDIVLDCFAGSGTTAAVAHKMGRRWVAVEWNEDTVQRYIIPRLRKVIEGQDPGGITESVGWEGGGGFRFVKVAPFMFTEVSSRVVLAEWATNGLLAQACAAQLGFEYVNDPPFCGRKGKLRLAVVDGMVNPDVVRLLVKRLSEEEQLVLCGTAVDPKAREELRRLRPGSSVRKIPSALLSGYRYRPPAYEWDDNEDSEIEIPTMPLP